MCLVGHVDHMDLTRYLSSGSLLCRLFGIHVLVCS